MNPRLQGLLFLAIVLGGVAGLIVGRIGWQERTIYSSGSPEPQLITAADLADHGPGDNVHVKVTDFVLGRRYALAERRGKWNRIAMPLVPCRAGLARKDLSAFLAIFLQNQPLAAVTCSSYFLPILSQKRAGIKIVVQSFHVSDKRQADRFYERYKQQPIKGIIVNGVHALGVMEQRELEKNYPGADFSSVLLLQEGRKFPSLAKVLLLLGSAALCLIAGLAAAVMLVISKRRALPAQGPPRVSL
jgi:hypothetical protein